MADVVGSMAIFVASIIQAAASCVRAATTCPVGLSCPVSYDSYVG